MDNSDYDPHQHRDRPHPTTNFETLIHLVKGSLGIGILAMPNAFHHSGLVTGVVATILISIISTYCIHILVTAQYELCKRLKVPFLSYPESMKVALEQGPDCLKRFASYSPALVDGFLVVYQLGICCVYILFVSSNIKQVADHYIEPMDLKIYTSILLVPLILVNYVRNLKKLAPFSTAANVIIIVGLIMILIYVFDDFPPIDSAQMFGSIEQFPLYFGTTLFSLIAIGVFVSLENNMQTPESFGGYCGVLNIGMIGLTILYTFIGFVGYVKYGEDAKGSITLNLPNEQILAQCIKIMYAIAILISYALHAYIPFEVLWNNYVEPKIKSYKIVWEYVLRTLVALVTFLLAISVPRLGLFISLVGVLGMSALGIAFPAIIEMCVKWPDNFGPFRFHLYKNIFIIVFGIISFIIGTSVSLAKIIQSFD